MANGTQESPTPIADKINAIISGVGLDQAPSPQEAPKKQTLSEKINAILAQPRTFQPTVEPGVVGLGKGLLEGITGPFRLFGLDPDLDPRRRVEGEPFRALPATPSRILGEFTGAAAPIILSTAGAGAFLGASGLEIALGPALSRVVADAIGFGLYEAGGSESIREVPENFTEGAAIGAAFGIGHQLLFGRLKGRSQTWSGETLPTRYGEDILDPIVIVEPPPSALSPGPRGFISSGARGQGPGRPVPPGGFETTRPVPGEAAGGVRSGVPPTGVRGSDVVTTRVTPGLHKRLLERATAGPLNAALEAGRATSKAVVLDLGTAARVELKKVLEELLNEGNLGASAAPAARLRGELGEAVKSSKPYGVEPTMFGSTEEFASAVQSQALLPTKDRFVEHMRRYGGEDFGFNFDAPLIPGNPPVQVFGMGYPLRWAGETATFSSKSTLTRGLKLNPAGTEVYLTPTSERGGGFYAWNPRQRGSVPFLVGRGDVGAIEEATPRTVKFPLGVGDNGELVLPFVDELNWVSEVLGTGVKDIDGEPIFGRITDDTINPGLRKLRDHRVTDQFIVFTPEEAQLAREGLISMRSKLKNTELSEYTSFSTLDKITRVLERDVISTALSMFDRYAPTFEEIIDSLSRELIPPDRQIAKRTVQMLKGKSTDFPFAAVPVHFNGRTTIYVDPDAAALEASFFRNRDYEEVFKAVGFALNQNDQLMVAAARAGAAFNSGGTTIVPLKTENDVNRIIEAMSKVDPNLLTAVYEGRWGPELLISHPTVKGPRSLISQQFVEEDFAVIKSLLDPRTNPKGEVDRLLRILGVHPEGELSPDVRILTGFETSDFGGLFGGGAYGTYTGDLPDVTPSYAPAIEPIVEGQIPGEIIRLATEGADATFNQQIGTLVHEYTHHLIVAVANRNGFDSEEVLRLLQEYNTIAGDAGIKDFFGQIKQVLPHWNPTPEEYQRVFGSSLPSTDTDVSGWVETIGNEFGALMGETDLDPNLWNTYSMFSDGTFTVDSQLVEPEQEEILFNHLTNVVEALNAEASDVDIILDESGILADGTARFVVYVQPVSDDAQISEIMRAALQVRARTGEDMFTPVPEDSPVWTKALEDFKENVKNFRSDTELAARLIELMAVDMPAAQKLAPTATKLFTEVIDEFSPRLSLIVRGMDIAKIGDIVDEKAIIGRIRTLRPIEKYSRETTTLSSTELKQFEETGVFAGMPVEVSGNMYIVERRLPTEGEYTEKDKVIVRDPYTGNRFKARWERMSRPGDPGLSTPTAKMPDILERLTDRPPNRIGLVVEDQKSGLAWRESIDLDTRGDARPLFFESYDEALDYLVTASPDLEEFTLTPVQILKLLQKNLQKAKLGDLAATRKAMVKDGNSYTLVLGDGLKPPSSGSRKQAIRPRESFDRINAKAGDTIISLDAKTISEGYLAGRANDRDLPMLTDWLAQAIEHKAVLGLPKELFQTWEVARQNPLPNGGTFNDVINEAIKLAKELGFHTDPVQVEAGIHKATLGDAAARKGARHTRTTDGAHRVDTEATDYRRKAGLFDSVEDYYDYLRQTHARRQKMGGLDESSSKSEGFDNLGSRENIGRGGTGGEPPPPGGNGTRGPTSDGSQSSGGPGLGGGGGTRGPRFQETMDGDVPPPDDKWYHRLSDATQFFGAFVTAMENTAKIIQRRFGLPAYDGIFKPLQAAVRKVDLELKAPRGSLDGKSFHDQLKLIEKLLWKVKLKERRANIIRYLEAMSKEEIARPGGLMQRGMNPLELKTSRLFTAMGVGDDMPYLISTWRMMTNLLKGRKQFIRQYRQMSRLELEPRIKENLEALRAASRAKGQWEFEELAAKLGLTNEQRTAIKVLEEIKNKKLSPDQFSIYAVSRHASARPLPQGYKTMREAVAGELGLNDLELRIAAELDKLFKASFEVSGIDPKRYLGGYYPHLRQYVREGIMPDAPYIRDVFPRAASFTGNKFRSGELDPYSMEPLKVAVKHVRGMLMHQHFDPLMKDVNATLRELYITDRRAFRLMKEYVSELQGKPHATFTDLQKKIEGVAKILNVDVDRDFSRQVINSLAAVTYGATIPFRFGLIARNYFQMVQMIAPRVGMQDFVNGLRIALTRDGWAMAKQAGAITENVAPIMSQEQLFNFTGLRLSQRMQRLTEVGFRWYQKADDIGRAAAYHAQRIRTGRAIDRLMKGQYGNPRLAKSKLQMLREGKVLTFDPADQDAFVKLFDAGRFEEAKSFLGEQLARETIFRYGHANHPAGWGSTYGRLFGQFGTWPVQYKDYLLQGITRGTWQDRVQFLATHGAINYGIMRAGIALGYDLNGWVSYPSLQYTGGPWADIAMDLVKLHGGTARERAMARQSLEFQFIPTLSDPRAIWLPTSYSINDLSKLLSSEPRLDEALGFRRIEMTADENAWAALNR